MEEENKEEKQEENVSRETIDYEKKYNELLSQSNKDQETIARLNKEKEEAISTLISFGTKKGEEPNEFEEIFGRVKI